MANVDPIEIRQRVASRYRRWKFFLLHLAAYVGGNLFFWGIWFFLKVGIITPQTPSDLDPWPLIMMLMWGIVVVIHALTILVAPWFRASQERAIQRETEQEMLRAYSETDEKPKRQVVRLADDGELEYEEDLPERKTSRQTR